VAKLWFFLLLLCVQRDDKKAIDWYVKAANQSNASAQCDLGWMHFYGYGVPKDPSRAVDWYTKAALQGHAISASNLGLSYKDGTGTRVLCVMCAVSCVLLRSTRRWAHIFVVGMAQAWTRTTRRRTAGSSRPLREDTPRRSTGPAISLPKVRHTATTRHDQRHDTRLTSITRATGQGTKKDEAKAAYWYFQAAEGGFLRAQVAIGSLLWRGRGTAQNMDEALKWCAQPSACICLYLGLRADDDDDNDVRRRRLTKAAESKDMEGMKACFKLGQIYEEKAEHATVSLTPPIQPAASPFAANLL
jgi:hypothetical protein